GDGKRQVMRTFLAAVTLSLLVAAALAQEPSEKARTLVQQLRATDSEDAKRDLYSLGAAALPALSSALEAEADPAAWTRLAEPFVSALVADAKPGQDGKLGPAARDLAIERFAKQFGADDPALRRFGEESLFGMGDLARPALEAIEKDGTPDAKYRARRLLQR